ncbi:outer membrane beta-barrel protein [Segetibacter aerophilus]|uniref:Outer membrane protein beta-barrel domain-containing protein n=1 Tax=Segetibacter aerophilus TaxID=670293 RepID=A0A512BHN2_9BACT|nr:outer membrane beta-barrel protein [Segetibacter aerophilus]GEO11460.1 hypothetical protein SAE01_39560 [Segetibacter aerophilus]
MKRIYMAFAALMVAGASFAQTETTKPTEDTTVSTADTIKAGNFIIIKKRRENAGEKTTTNVTIERKPYKPSKISTNWWIFDLGFANVNDKTNYASAEAQSFLRSVGPGGKPGKEDLKLRSSKTSNVNIWVVMQRLNLAKGYVNLKYGLGLEMFNFRYENSIRYNKSPNYIYKDSISFSKDKLYAGYATVPFMLNINTSPGRKKGLSISAGVSAGYLVGSHTKEVSAERGKQKTKGDLGLEKFRLAYVGELGIGPIRLFGSYSLTKLHENGLEQYPYSLGIRFSNW